MKIVKQGGGWLVQPSTSEEQQALSLLFEALHLTYAVPVETSKADVLQATHLPTAVQNPSMVS